MTKAKRIRFIAIKGYSGIFKDTSSDKYVARKMISGKRYNKTFKKLSEAINWKNSFNPSLQSIDEFKNLQPKKSKRLNGVEDEYTFKQVWELYDKLHISSILRQSATTIRKRMNSFFPDFAHLRMVDLNAKVLDDIIKLKVEKAKDSTSSKRYNFDLELKTLRALCNWYKENYDEIFVTPVLKRHFAYGKVKTKKSVSKEKMSLEEFKLFYDCLDDDFNMLWKDFAETHFYMAGRAQEPAGLQHEKVCLDKEIIRISDVTVWGDNKRFLYLKECPKNKEDRSVHINLRLKTIMSRRIKYALPNSCNYFRESTGERLNFVFHINGQPLNKRAIDYRYNKALKKAGLFPKFSATHILRKAMANVVRQELGLDAAQAVGGWKSREVVEKIYTNPAPSSLNVKAVSLVEKMLKDLE